MKPARAAALAGGWLGGAAARSRRVGWIVTLALVAFFSLVYESSSQRRFRDSRFTLLVSEALLRHGSWDVAPFLPGKWEELSDPASWRARQREWQLRAMDDGRLLYIYPPGTPLFSAPLLLAARPFGATVLHANGSYDADRDRRLQIVLAALLVAIAVGTIHRLALRELPAGPAAAVALAAGLGSALWSGASRYLWAHAWASVWVGLALLELLRWEDGERRRPVLAGLLLGAAFWARPSGALVAAPAAVFVALRHRPALLRLVASGAVAFAAFVAWSWGVWGHWLPGYVRIGAVVRGSEDPIASFLGQLVSLEHGLLVWSPVLVAVAAGLALRGVAPGRRAFATLAVAVVAAHVLFYATKQQWWGPGTEGNRFLAEVTPALAWLGAHAWRRVAAAAPAGGGAARLRRIAVRSVVVVLALLGVAAHASGAVGMEWPRTDRARRAGRIAPAGEGAPPPWWMRTPQATTLVWIGREWWPAHRPGR